MDKKRKVSTKDNKNIDSIKELRKRLEEVEKKAQENLDGWKRARADLINFEKRVGERNQEIIKFASEGLILKILPVLDNLERAHKHIPKEIEKSGWIKGFVQIKNQLENILKDFGVEKIKAQGERFNSEEHEAIAKIKSAKGQDTERVFRVVQDGYKLNGKVIRPAKVVVACG